MASTDVDKVLPNTEAMRDAIELLNAMENDSFVDMSTAVLDNVANNINTTASAAASSSSESSSKAVRKRVAQEAAIRFIVYQLTYFSVNKHNNAVAALSEEVTSASSTEAVSLGADKAEALAALWVEKGKDIVQQARTNLIRKVCNGTNAASAAIVYGGGSNAASSSSAGGGSGLSSSSAITTTLREPHIHCSTTIKMGSGSVLEVAPETPEGAIKVTRAAETMDFTPLATLTLPGGATVEMNEEQAYGLFSELDAIQRQMDSLFASA